MPLRPTRGLAHGLQNLRVRLTPQGRARLRGTQADEVQYNAELDANTGVVLTPAMTQRLALPEIIVRTDVPVSPIRTPATWEPTNWTTNVVQSAANLYNGTTLITVQQDREYGPGRMDTYPGPRFIGMPTIQFTSGANAATDTITINTWPRYLSTLGTGDRQFFGLVGNPYTVMPQGTNTFARQVVGWNLNNAPETAEERAAREAFEAARATAKVTAEKLLKRYLDEEQREEWERDRRVTVRSQKGNLYQIREGASRNIDLLVEGKPVRRYCIHTADAHEIPYGDTVLAQKLLLETDEARFLAIANASVIQRTPGGILLAA